MRLEPLIGHPKGDLSHLLHGLNELIQTKYNISYVSISQLVGSTNQPQELLYRPISSLGRKNLICVIGP